MYECFPPPIVLRLDGRLQRTTSVYSSHPLKGAGDGEVRNVQHKLGGVHDLEADVARDRRLCGGDDRQLLAAGNLNQLRKGGEGRQIRPRRRGRSCVKWTALRRSNGRNKGGRGSLWNEICCLLPVEIYVGSISPEEEWRVGCA